MWRTREGERVLEGAEWNLFQEGLGSVWDAIEMESDDTAVFDTPAFDALSYGQKLATLALVGQALRDEDVPAPGLTACSEATIAAVYRHIAREIAFEIDMESDRLDDGAPSDPDDFSWRKLVLAAYAEAEEVVAATEALPPPDPARTAAEGEDDQDWSPPPAGSRDMDGWSMLLECLRDRVLWEDEDYDHDPISDQAPEDAACLKDLLRIPNDYYVVVAPDPTDAELEEVHAKLRRICGRREPELVDGLLDLHHDLLVGPCDREAIDHEAASPLVEEIGHTHRDDFDCSYDEWAEHFRAATAAAPAPEPPADLASLPGPEWAEPAEAAARLGMPLRHEHGIWIEPADGRWVVRDAHDRYLEELRYECWSLTPPGPGEGISFASPLEALGAFLWARGLSDEREARHREAIRLLEREGDEDQPDW